jgi:hypothetical protein
VSVVAKRPDPGRAGEARMAENDILPEWLSFGPGFTTSVAPDALAKMSADEKQELVRPHTWQGQWADFVAQYFPILGTGGQTNLMRFLMFLCTPSMRKDFFWHTFEMLLEHRTKTIKKRGAEERKQLAVKNVLDVMHREGMTEEQCQNIRPTIELDLSGRWTPGEQAQWEAGVDRSLFEMVGSRNVALIDLLSQSDNFVRTVTNTLHSRTVSAHRDKTGKPAKKQCTPRQPQRVEGDDEDPERGAPRLRDTARKRRRTDKQSNETDLGDIDDEVDDEDVCD